MPSPEPVLESTIACPNCGARKTEAMPTDTCRFFYRCESCGEMLRSHILHAINIAAEGP